MKTIVLSPHLDDAAFSCGGWIWEQTQQGLDLEIWTICAGDPPQAPLSGLAEMLHRNWHLPADPVQHRREEDRAACRILGAKPHHYPYLDCIYRKAPDGAPFYTREEDLFGGLDPRESALVDDLARRLEDQLPPGAEILAPLGIGNHVDHELTRKAASRLSREVLYYPDFPYAREGEGKEILQFMDASPDWKRVGFPVSEGGMEGWFQAAQQYGSQLSTFWEDASHLQAEIVSFAKFMGGVCLWRAQDA